MERNANNTESADLEPVRLVIWDLDETFWKGTLSEGGIEYQGRHHDIVVELARRGIISSICSKNELNAVRHILSENGIWDLFVFPNISWEPKGPRVAAIVEAVQLRPASVMLIDDNLLNLNEARFFVPQLQIETEAFIGQMLTDRRLRGRDDNTLTRLKQYKLLEKRNIDQHVSGAGNHAFLRSSSIKVTIDTNIEANIDRAVELINRTNQLNFTKKRLPEDALAARSELSTFLAGFQMQAGLIHVQDKYGDYGYCGFYCYDILLKRLVHFCFSCRLLNMGVEQWLYNRLGRPSLTIEGVVVSNLDDPASVDWITLTMKSEQHESSDTKLYRTVYIRGGCELEVIGFYMSLAAQRVIAEHNVDRGGLAIRLDHTCMLPLIFQELDPAHQECLAEVGFMSEVLSSKLTTDSDIDLAVLAFTADVTFAQYRHKETGLIIPVGICAWFHDITRYSLAEIDQQFSSPALRGLAYIIHREYDYLGQTTETQFKQNLMILLGQIGPAKRVCVLLLVEQWTDEQGQIHSLADRINVNRWTEEVMASRAHTTLIDLNKVVVSSEVIDPNHFHRRAYYRIYEAVRDGSAG